MKIPCLDIELTFADGLWTATCGTKTATAATIIEAIIALDLE